MSAALRLTESQRIVLRFAARATSDEYEGIHPRRGQHQMFAGLVARGLLIDVGPGVSADNHEKDVTLYAITDAGRNALASHKVAKAVKP